MKRLFLILTCLFLLCYPVCAEEFVDGVETTTGDTIVNPTIIGGTITGTPISGSTGSFTTLSVTQNFNPTKGSDVASAGAMTLGNGNIFDITGVTTINTIVTKGVGSIVVLEFDGILQLTHSADLFLPSAANITTAAGDIAVFYEYATGDWRCYNYMRANGNPLSLSSPGAIGGTTPAVGAFTTATLGNDILDVSGKISFIGSDNDQGQLEISSSDTLLVDDFVGIEFYSTTSAQRFSFTTGGGGTGARLLMKDSALTNVFDFNADAVAKFEITGVAATISMFPSATHGGYVRRTYYATSGTLAGATDRIELNIPTGWIIKACQLHVKTEVSDDDGDDTWGATLDDGAQVEVLTAAGTAKAQNTNVNHLAHADAGYGGTLTDAETDILLTVNGSNFDGGEIEAHCLCFGFDPWTNE